jgi:hypothetical protein
MNKNILLILLCLFLVGCAAQPMVTINPAPNVTKPIVTEPIVNTTTEQPKEVLVNIYRIYAGRQPVYIINNTIINCGDTAYGLTTADTLENYYINTISITNTSIEYIGGCPDILRRLNIKQVNIYDKPTDTKAYSDLIKWTPKDRLKIHQEPLTLTYEGQYINLSSITEDTTTIYKEERVRD